MKTGSILVVDDNKNVLSALRILLENYFQQVTLISSPNQLPSKLRELTPDVVLLDMNFSAGINSGNEGLFWLSEIKKVDGELPVVLFTAYADIDLAVKALKEGASDFVVKPWDNAKLIATLQAAYALRQSQREVKRLREKQGVLSRELNLGETICWGHSAVMHELRRLVEKVAKTDANILVTGENGTGKELIAREIHRLSSRKNEVLVTVDMGAVSETLFESELFGHVKGAFTDARTDRAGKFEAADGGTLFLDEIGNLSYPLQAKLLTAIQSRQIVRVGDNKAIPVNIRLICATNRNLDQSVQNGEFREDLLYRVNTIHVEAPPLRERKADIPQLADFFLQKYASKYGKKYLTFDKQTIIKLEDHAWPGNVRELQHAIEKAVILCDSNELLPSDFYMKEQNASTSKIENMSLEDAERLLIGNSIKKNGGNLSAVATELGITRPTLYSKIKKYVL
ncbi:sigma-54-dependent transcriptional regulator [Flavobacterium undicola]|uniref:sigma-54-dependent transcriptional regulator n=1 Tax=Flavobacterium undicola TaxID=1932779 RepID=UPI001377B6E2|nr:sigma-54 dependent transcriptional regulator [Flavobacterium undicola]MBA0882912.1 sigma-54-dependent Fis family transcriptional regulator [Flavobacterium undicola]